MSPVVHHLWIRPLPALWMLHQHAPPAHIIRGAKWTALFRPSPRPCHIRARVDQEPEPLAAIARRKIFSLQRRLLMTASSLSQAAASRFAASRCKTSIRNRAQAARLRTVPVGEQRPFACHRRNQPQLLRRTRCEYSLSTMTRSTANCSRHGWARMVTRFRHAMMASRQLTSSKSTETSTVYSWTSSELLHLSIRRGLPLISYQDASAQRLRGDQANSRN